MRIKTTCQVNAHTQDGREFTADEGSVLEIDADDAGMVGLAKSLIMSGQAQHYGDVGSVHEEPPTIDFDDSTDEVLTAVTFTPIEDDDDLEDNER